MRRSRGADARSPPRLRDAGHGALVSYSRKVFIPLTQLCRDVCHYCTFAHPPRRGERGLSRRPTGAGDRPRRRRRPAASEALFTLGDKPELRYRAAREELARARPRRRRSPISPRWPALVLQGDRAAAASQSRRDEPRDDLDALREVSVSQGIMLETASERLSQRGGPHFGSPDKVPARRLATHRGGRRGGGAVHHRHPDRHRRDAARAHRGAAGAARSARAPRPHPGNHRPEFPRQARHAHGGGARARSRRPSVDDRGGAADLRAGDEHPGAAQSDARRARGDDRRRHQRLGRRVAGDARPRQSRGAVAGARRAGASAPPPPASCWSSGWRSIPAYARDPTRWLDAGAAHAGAARASMRKASRAPTRGSPGAGIAAAARRARRGAGRAR